MIDYYQKYIKYRTKYLNLQNDDIMVGGKPKNNKKLLMDKIVIHISGPSGAGKTTLGNKLQKKFGNKIVVVDIDDLRTEFVKDRYGGYQNVYGVKNFVWDKEAYQQWIDNYVKSISKPLVFVGLNHMPWWGKKLYYDMHADYKFYIDMDTAKIFGQKCGRFLADLVQNRDPIISDIIDNETKTIKQLQLGIKHECGYAETDKMNDVWNRDYKSQNYVFMTSNDIYNNVSKILKKYI